MTSQELSTGVLNAIQIVATNNGFNNYTLETNPISCIGENSYGSILQTKITCNSESKDPFFCVIKIAPMNVARRQHMKVVEYYQREVFMYENVLKAFQEIQEKENIPPERRFDAVPKIYFSSLKNMEEFIIFEDLTQSGFVQNSRRNPPNFELTMSTLKALAMYHAMSFVMQAKQPGEFEKLVNEIRFKDNLYTPDIDQFTIEFAKKYILRTQTMIADDKGHTDQAQSEVLQIFEENFKDIALKTVNGGECAPYSVFCHGDFWNNNILYRYDESNNRTVAKLIDFQMSRYASPVLDIVHYLFTCTEKELRDAHFDQFLQSYYNTLSEHLRLFNLDSEQIFPRKVFNSHLRTYGCYGFCMAILSIPFFIIDASDYPDLDTVTKEINNLSSDGSDSEDKKASESGSNAAEILKRTQNLVNKCELLNEKTFPVFKRRITGVVKDLFKYDMVDEVIEFSKQIDQKQLDG